MASRTPQRTGSTLADPSSQSPFAYFFNLVSGRVLSLDFFRRHWGATCVVMIFLLLSITNKYHSLTSMERTKELKKELETVQTERIRAKSVFMSRTRESAMQELIDSLRLGLSVQAAPPYVIEASR